MALDIKTLIGKKRPRFFVIERCCLWLIVGGDEERVFVVDGDEKRREMSRIFYDCLKVQLFTAGRSKHRRPFPIHMIGLG